MEKHLHMAGGQVSLPPPGVPDHLFTTSKHAPLADTNVHGARTGCGLALDPAAGAPARLPSTVCCADTLSEVLAGAAEADPGGHPQALEGAPALSDLSHAPL